MTLSETSTSGGRVEDSGSSGGGRYTQTMSRVRILLISITALATISCAKAGQPAGAREGVAPPEVTKASAAGKSSVSPVALHQRLTSGERPPVVIDVREPDEYAAGHIEHAQLVPLGMIGEGLDVPKDHQVVLVCRSGRRSGQAQETLAAQGYTNVSNMQGGMLAWESAGLPVAK